MNESTGEQSEPESDQNNSLLNESQKTIRQNLSNFLNPGLPVTRTQAPDPNGALSLRMAQMELANKMRLNKDARKDAPKVVPMRPTPPPGGFGSAAGVFHMQRGDFGSKSAPTPPAKRSPYQQIFESASKPEEAVQKKDENGSSDTVIEIPEGSEVRQDEKQKRLRGKRFQNPSL